MTATASPPAFGYATRTVHGRFTPYRRHFSYRMFHLLLDIDRLAETDKGLKLFAVNRPGLFSFREKDHGPKDGTPLRPWAEDLWHQAGVALDGGKIWLMCLPRMLGYVFNPISVWFGFGPEGDLRGAIYEVRNTFGENHCYVSAAPLAPHATAKAFHVSPFFAVNGDYRFGLTAPEEHFGLRVENWVDGALTHRATLSGTRKPLTDLGLLKVLAEFPLMTLGVTAAIHWQALWIWLKGARYHPKPAAPTTAMSATAPVPITHPKRPADQG